MLRKLKRVESPGDLVLLLRILVVAALMPRLAERVDLPRLLSVLGRRRYPKACDARTCRRIILFTNYVLSLNAPIIRNTCLIRSLVLFHFLRKAGKDVHLNIGVEKVAGGVLAHSWLAGDDGSPLVDTGSVCKYHVIYSSDAERRR